MATLFPLTIKKQNILNNESQQNKTLLGTADYIGALDTICSNTLNNLYIFDKDFINCGFNSSTRFELLNKFLLANPKNQLMLLAHDTLPLSQYCPRLMTLLQTFGHNMFIYQTPQNLQHLSEPFAVADQSHYTRRFHFDDPRGILALNDREGAALLQSRFMEMWSPSHPNIATNTFSL